MLLLAHDIDQCVKATIAMSNRRLSFFLRLREFGLRLREFGKCFRKALIRVAPGPAFTQSSANHQLGNPFEPRQSHLVLLIVDGYLRKRINDELHFAFELFV